LEIVERTDVTFEEEVEAEDPDKTKPFVFEVSDGKRFDMIAVAISAPTAEHFETLSRDFTSRLLISIVAIEF